MAGHWSVIDGCQSPSCGRMVWGPGHGLGHWLGVNVLPVVRAIACLFILALVSSIAFSYTAFLFSARVHEEWKLSMCVLMSSPAGSPLRCWRPILLSFTFIPLYLAPGHLCLPRRDQPFSSNLRSLKKVHAGTGWIIRRRSSAQLPINSA